MQVSNLDWCPFDIGTRTEEGDTVKIEQRGFDRYLSKLKRWTFYFFVPQKALTSQLTEVFGSTATTMYELPQNAYAINRYGRMLAGEVSLQITPITRAGDHLARSFPGVTFLPYIRELEQKEALNLILEDLIGKPQQALPPDWVDQIQMPFVDAINAAIAEKIAAIDTLRQEIAVEEQKRTDIEKWRKLVYVTGHELEQVFEEAVRELGATTAPPSAEEEFIFEHNGSVGIVECKGVTKSISLAHVRQAADHVMRFEENENRKGKGVLLSNAWRNLSPSERGKPDTQVFPDNVVARATQQNIALVSATDFLEVFYRYLSDEVSGEAILDAIMTQSGIVDFQRLQ